MECHLVEIRRTEHILSASRTNGIKPHGRKHIPGRGLPVVLVATIPVGLCRVETVHHLPYPVLRLPWLTGVIVEIDHVLDRLVAMSVIAHVHDLHLPYLVDDTPVVTLIEEGWHIEHRVEHLHEDICSTHETYQSHRVVEHRPCVVPCVSLSEGIPPFQRTERRLERPVGVAAAHQKGLFVEYFFIVECPVVERQPLTLVLAQLPAQHIDAPIIVGILQGARHTLIDADVIRHITQFVVLFVAQAAC